MSGATSEAQELPGVGFTGEMAESLVTHIRPHPWWKKHTEYVGYVSVSWCFTILYGEMGAGLWLRYYNGRRQNSCPGSTASSWCNLHLKRQQNVAKYIQIHTQFLPPSHFPCLGKLCDVLCTNLMHKTVTPHPHSCVFWTTFFDHSQCMKKVIHSSHTLYFLSAEKMHLLTAHSTAKINSSLADLGDICSSLT